MKLLKATLFITFTILLLSGCSSGATPSQQPVVPPAPEPTAQPSAQPSTLEFSNPAQTISVPVGVSFTISLKSNPTTGYSWQVGFNQSLLKMIRHYTPANTGLVGAGGVENFEFQGLKAGEGQIDFEYKRPFEPNNPPQETKTFKVIIK
jgi:inhibitor of cysteine peptidase